MATHRELFDARNNLVRTQNFTRLDSFNDEHPYFDQRSEIFDTLLKDQDDNYIYHHMPLAAEIYAILSFRITMTRETYIDPPTYPDGPHFVADFDIDLDKFIETWWKDFIELRRHNQHVDNGTSTATASASSSSTSTQQPPVVHVHSRERFLPV